MDFSFQNGSNCKCFDISNITKAHEDKSLTRTRYNLISCDIFLELNFLHTVAVLVKKKIFTDLFYSQEFYILPDHNSKNC